MTQNGTLGTANRPTAISTELLSLLNGEADRLLALGIDAAETQDGTLVFTDKTGSYTGQFGSQEVIYYEGGTGHPVTAAEWVDSSGASRPVSQWHLGPLGVSGFAVTITDTTFAEGVALPNGRVAVFQTREDWEDEFSPRPEPQFQTREDWE